MYYSHPVIFGSLYLFLVLPSAVTFTSEPSWSHLSTFPKYKRLSLELWFLQVRNKRLKPQWQMYRRKLVKATGETSFISLDHLDWVASPLKANCFICKDNRNLFLLAAGRKAAGGLEFSLSTTTSRTFPSSNPRADNQLDLRHCSHFTTSGGQRQKEFFLDIYSVVYQ